MYTYNFLQWLMFFYIYCFVGWVIESTIVSVEEKRFVNRGFLRSPFLPLYGFGAIVILFVSIPVRDNHFLVYLFGMIGTTILEYFTGWLMEQLFKVKYWDYSKQKFNFKGRICVTSSLFWGVLSLFLTEVLHKPVESFVLGLDRNLELIIVIVISALLLSDLVYSFKTAVDVSRIYAKIEEIKKESEALKEQLEAKWEDRVEASERLSAIRGRISELKEEHSVVMKKISAFHKDFILAHPSATSKKFGEAIMEVRERLGRKSPDDDDDE